MIVPDRYFSEFTPLEDLPSNTRYYWRVRAFDVMGEYSNWSSARNFRPALSIPVLDTPSDGESVFSSSPTFTWSGGAGAASYTLQIALSPSFSSLTASATLPGYSYTYPRALRSGRLYYWRVRANGSNGPSFWSQPRTFYIP